MTFIDSLGRSRFGLFLAWLAVASLGSLAAQRDPVGAHWSGDGAQVSVIRTLVDAPTHIARIVAVKLTPHVRADGDDRRDPGGPDPVLLPLLLSLPLQTIEFAAFAIGVPPDHGNAPIAPYAARAPPLSSI